MQNQVCGPVGVRKQTGRNLGSGLSGNEKQFSV